MTEREVQRLAELAAGWLVAPHQDASDCAQDLIDELESISGAMVHVTPSSAVVIPVGDNLR